MWRIFKRRRAFNSIVVGCLFGALVSRCLRAEDEAPPGGGLREKIRERLKHGKGASSESQTQATQPTQPTSGPGSSEYPYGSVKTSNFGAGDQEFWIFEPADSKPETAPVIVFMHGWSVMDTAPYIDWVNHLVRRGNIVIYPRYQAKLTTAPATFTPNTVAAIKQALTVLDGADHVHPDRDKVAIVGHSFGGIIAANIAAVAASEAGMPVFKAVMCVEPGNGGFPVNADYSKIPAKTLLLCVAGDQDKLVKDKNAKEIFAASTAVAAADKNYILVNSDNHGSPALTADHFAPVAFGWATNALDWFGYWKWCDGLTDAAFYGKNRQYALGNTTEQRFMGKWSDGQPVTEPTITEAK